MKNLILVVKLENYQEVRSKCPEYLREHLAGFFKDWLKELNNINIGGENSEIKALCHKWKGFMVSYGLKGLGDALIVLEQKLNDKTIENEIIIRNIDLIKDYLAKLIRESL